MDKLTTPPKPPKDKLIQVFPSKPRLKDTQPKAKPLKGKLVVSPPTKPLAKATPSKGVSPSRAVTVTPKAAEIDALKALK